MQAILMCDSYGVIGINGDQPLHLSEDLYRFQYMTKEKSIIYGKTTLQTFPNGKPLSNRENLILSTTIDKSIESEYEKVKVFSSSLELFRYVVENNRKAYVIGGQKTFETMYPYIDTLFLTIVNTKFQTSENDTIAKLSLNKLSVDFKEVMRVSDKDYCKETHTHYDTTFIEYNRNLVTIG